MNCTAYCQQCAKKHDISFDPLIPDSQFSDWYTKHAGHKGVGIAWPERRKPTSLMEKLRALWKWARRPLGDGSVVVGMPTPHVREISEELEYEPGVSGMLAAMMHNADTKITYAASAAYTITLASLATSSTLVAGREGTAVSNTTNLYLDYLIGGRITVGTTPTASTTIEVWAYASVNDTPTYPDVFDGTDSAETVTSAGIKYACLRQLASMAVDATTSDRVYWFAPTSLANLHGGAVPKNHGLFCTHSTAVNLNATGGNHVLDHTGVYLTTA